MPKIIIKDVPPYDGEYELELSGLTNRDYHFIKQVSGVRAGELNEALQAGDIGVFVAVASLILKRNGFADVHTDALWDAEESCFQVAESDADRAAEDADRPLAIEDPNGTLGGSEKSSDSNASENEKQPPSGSNGNTDGEDSQRTPLLTGSPGSVTRVDSDPAIWPV